MMLDYFKDSRVLITGHTGFKGSWLALALRLAGAQVVGYSLPPSTTPNHFDMLSIPKDEIGDIRNREKLNKIFKDFKPEFIFHLAAQPIVRRSYAEPVYTYETNIMGAINILECIRQHGGTLVLITSDKCYENNEWTWGYRENDRLGGHDPYSASKAAVEIVFSSYSKSFLKGIATARAGNVIGGGDWASDRIVPDLIRSIHSNKPIQLRNPHSTRPWQHVLEPLSGYCKLARELRESPDKFTGSWNFGPDNKEIRTVESIIGSLITKMKMGSYVIADQPQLEEVFAKHDSNYESNLLQLNCDKAFNILKWSPRWGIDKTLEKTAYWYKEYFQGSDMLKISISQIEEYYE